MWHGLNLLYTIRTTGNPTFQFPGWWLKHHNITNHRRFSELLQLNVNLKCSMTGIIYYHSLRYQLSTSSNASSVDQQVATSCSRPQLATDDVVRDEKSNWLAVTSFCTRQYPLSTTRTVQIHASHLSVSAGNQRWTSNTRGNALALRPLKV